MLNTIFNMTSVHFEAHLVPVLRVLHGFGEERLFQTPYKHGYYFLELDDGKLVGGPSQKISSFKIVRAT